MAYANLIAQSCNNPIETFLRFRDFMCKRNGTYDYSTTGIGWTLHDAVYATNEDTIAINDYFVMFSAGEDGTRSMYFKVTYISGYINVQGYRYWNNSTHAGVGMYGSTSSWTNTAATNNTLWIYGDLDEFLGLAKYGTTINACKGGWMPDSPIDQTIINCANAITAGSSVTVTFASVPGAWVTGKKLFVYDNANIERVAITGVSGNDVTFAAFVASYSAGCKFCQEITNHITGNSFTVQHYVEIDHAGVKNNYLAPEMSSVVGPNSGDALTGNYPARSFYLYSATTGMEGYSHMFLTPTTIASEASHTIGAVNYRSFLIGGTVRVMVKEV